MIQILLQVQTQTGILPNNAIQLIGILVPALAFIVGAYKGARIWAIEWGNTERAKSQHRLELEAAKLNKEIEVAKANQFTANAVKDMFTQILAVQKEIDEMKHASDLTRDHFSTLIEHLEKLLGDLSKNFTDFLMNKALNVNQTK